MISTRQTLKPFKLAYIECKDGIPFNAEAMSAWEGLYLLGIQVKPYTKADIALRTHKEHYAKALFVGTTDSLHSIFHILKKQPKLLDYPTQLIEKAF